MDDNWIVENLENALATWNEKLAEIWQLVSMTPQEFKGGGMWNIVVQINGALQAIGYKELKPFFEGTRTLAEATDNLKQATRRYAKRQLTWFRRRAGATTLYIDDYAAPERLADAAQALLSGEAVSFDPSELTTEKRR